MKLFIPQLGEATLHVSTGKVTLRNEKDGPAVYTTLLALAFLIQEAQAAGCQIKAPIDFSQWRGVSGTYDPNDHL